MLRVLAVVVLVHGAKSAFFDLTDVDDPLALFWNTKETVGKSAACVPSDDTTLSGVCKHKFHCLLSGGQPHIQSNCGFLSTCCVYPSTCSKTTKAKVSYFTSDHVTTATDCYYVAEPLNNNICQVRLDFENFQLSGPRAQEVDPNATPITYSELCTEDYLEISPLTYNIPPFICGYNTGQHVYVHLHSDKRVQLHVHLGTSPAGTNRQWKIKVTQLECPGHVNFFTKHQNSNASADFQLLAPEGAIQYYIEPQGRIRSFGFHGSGVLHYQYTSGLRYGIAFRRTPNTHCIRFTSNYLELRHKTGNPAPNIDDTYCQDYLFIPELATTIQDRYESQLCPQVLTGKTFFISKTPGPFYIHFVSAPTFTDRDPVFAFDINYELSTSALYCDVVTM